MPIGDKIKNFLTGGASVLVEKIGDAIDKNITSKEERETLKNEALKIINEHKAKVLEAETKRLEAVNQTMQAESKSEHFLQWSWRPLVGYCFIAICFNNYILLPYLHKYGVVPIEIPSDIQLAFMAILGVSAYWRGKQKAVNN